MISGWKNIRQQGQVPDLLEGLLFIGKFQELEVRPGHHHVFCLATLPSAQIETVSSAESELLVGVQAHIGVAFLAVPQCAAGDIKGNGYDVADLDALDMR